MRSAAFAAAYFIAVFAVGFALGTLRVTLVVPALGERIAELAEMPFMVAASVFFAWRFVRRWRLGVGAAFAGGVRVFGERALFQTRRGGRPRPRGRRLLRRSARRVHARAGRRCLAAERERPAVTALPSRYARRFAADSFSIA